MPGHKWAGVGVVNTPAGKLVRCPIVEGGVLPCQWSARVPRQNALAATAKLARMLREHVEREHPKDA